VPVGGPATSARTRRSTICPVPTNVAVLAVLGRSQYKLSLRNVAEMFLTVTHETAWAWEERLAPCRETGSPSRLARAAR